jgi:predicted  nucleic acid-binding Zn-ribbon protein
MIQPQTELLVALNHLELMIHEATDEAPKLKAMGFKIDGLEQLQKAQANLEKQLEPAILKQYKRLKERNGRPVVPVINGNCCGCYIKIPTALASDAMKNQILATCGNCGRFLYWPSE